MHTHAYIYSHIHTHIHLHIYIYTCTYIHTYICIYIHTYIHTHKYKYVYIYIHTHTHMHIHMYIYKYTNTHTYTRVLVQVKSDRATYHPDSKTALMRCQQRFEVRCKGLEAAKVERQSMHTIDRSSTPQHVVYCLSRPTCLMRQLLIKKASGQQQVILLGEDWEFPSNSKKALSVVQSMVVGQQVCC